MPSATSFFLIRVTPIFTPKPVQPFNGPLAIYRSWTLEIWMFFPALASDLHDSLPCKSMSETSICCDLHELNEKKEIRSRPGLLAKLLKAE